MEGLALCLCVLISVSGLLLLLAVVACHLLLACSSCMVDPHLCWDKKIYSCAVTSSLAASASSTDANASNSNPAEAAQVASSLPSPTTAVPARRRARWSQKAAAPAACAAPPAAPSAEPSAASAAAVFASPSSSPNAAATRKRGRWFADVALAPSAASRKLDELQQLLKKGWGGHISHVLPHGFCMLPQGVEAAYPSTGEELGRGGFGRVYRAQERVSGQEVAVKVVDKFEMWNMGCTLRPLRMELRGMLAMRGHPNAVQLLAVHEDRRHLTIVMESCEFGSLGDFMHSPFVRRMTEQQRVEMFVGILSAVEAAHQHGLIHSDIKPDNILVSRVPSSQPGCPKAVLKLADWGCSVQLRRKGESTMKLPFGTDCYMPPEMRRLWSGECRWGQYGQKVDVYAAGMTLWEFVEAAGGSCQDSMDLIEGMLAAKPRERLNSASALQQAMQLAL